MVPEIATWGGGRMVITDPKPEMIDIQDIAKSLACICRYTGHCNDFYSVAQHSILMANLTEFEDYGTPIQRLLHDSAEAYIGDMSRPWKCCLFAEIQEGNHPHKGRKVRVKTIEKKLLKVIGEALGEDLENLAMVKDADNIMMATEVRDLMHPEAQVLFASAVEGYKSLDYPIEPWPWEASYNLFLKCYHEFKTQESPNEHEHQEEKRVVA
jgi:hypothetical protein